MPITRRFSLFLFAPVLAFAPGLLVAQTCIADDFNAFLARFNGEIAVQKAHTADPLIIESFDFDLGDEPVQVANRTPLASLQWPVLPDLTLLDTSHLRSTVAREGEEVALLVAGVESGEHTTWYFRQQPCWTLVRIAELSMLTG